MSHMTAAKAREIVANAQRNCIESGAINPYDTDYYEATGYIAALEGPEVKALARAVGEAREMLDVFEDNGGHDGLGGKGYMATLKHIDDALAVYKKAVGR